MEGVGNRGREEEVWLCSSSLRIASLCWETSLIFNKQQEEKMRHFAVLHFTEYKGKLGAIGDYIDRLQGAPPALLRLSIKR